ncbi:hypothetical protein, conserved [Eimeria necatrix]|uniref:Uncharacterized protein n=1 Tax=Eimeria necatrix TaxID=51315 RepID=U6MKJ9_9EIME|nr:hypothetical protein, conserved [Eimeria necatrix]CDJ62175.1 hypothetical protein, conserved [Eimeria necatrix]
MLLLRCAPVGSYVHIGDFCCTGSNLQPLLQQVQQGLRLLQQLEDPEAAAAAAAVASDDSVSRAREHSGNVGFAGTPGRVASQQEEPHADVLYFDSTYLHPRFSFLSKEDAVAEMCQRMEVTFEGVFQNLRTRPTKGLLRGHRSRSLHVVVGVDNLGKESLLQQLGKALRAPIGLSEAQSDSAAAVAAAAAQANGTCAYSIEDFTRGLYCPVIRAVMSWIFTSTSWGSSSDNSTAVREMPACGCPWPNESRSAARPGHPQEQPWHEASQEDVEMLVGLSGEASQAAVPLFAVPRRLLLKVISALEASALSALGLLPSGASLEKGIHEGELAGSSSNNDSNSSNNSSSNSVDGYQNYRGVSQKVVARTRKLPERGNPNSSMQTNSVGTPITLLLDRIEAEEMILAVGVEGSEALNNNNSSAELAAMVGCYSPSVVASVPRGPVARSKAPSVCGAFNYDGREGSAAFVEATELPIVVLGSGRRLFCPHGCPRRCLRGSCTYMCRKRNRIVACSAEDSRRMEVKAYGSPSVLPDSREPGVPPQARITPELVTGTGNETSVLPFRKVSRAVRRLRFVSRA